MSTTLATIAAAASITGVGRDTITWAVVAGKVRSERVGKVPYVVLEDVDRLDAVLPADVNPPDHWPPLAGRSATPEDFDAAPFKLS